MILVLDLGNTNVKIAVFELDKLVLKEVFDHSSWKTNAEIILKKYTQIRILVTSNVKKEEDLKAFTFSKDHSVHIISKEKQFPFNNLYQTPETLGIDRMVLAAGAVLQYPKQHCLIIDAGTCVTFDYVDEHANYLGGAISLGIELRYKALHNFTANLPLLQKEIPQNIIGNSTNSAIHSGVINGLLFEINQHIENFEINKKNFIIILTGGDAVFLAKRLKNTIFANPNFLLESLNQLYQFQQK